MALLAGALAVAAALSPSAGETQQRFSNGGTSALLKFPEGGGSFSNMSITLPRAATIASATVDIEGRQALYGPAQHTVDFQVPAGSRAWAGVTGSVPPAGAPSTFETLNITAQPALKASDDSRYTTNGVNMAPYHLFEFYVGFDALASFWVNWEGIGFSNPQIGFGSNGATLYLWNNASGGWDFQQKNGAGEVPQEVYLGSTATCATSYVDSNGYINAFVCPAIMAQNRIETDYVKLDYSGYRTVWPADPGLDVGSDGSVEWAHGGQLNGKKTFSGPVFVNALQGALNASMTENVTVPLKFSAGAGGILFVSNLSITYLGRDLPPVLKKNLPSQMTVPEDGQRTAVPDLRDYFDDDRGASNLTFNVSWMSDWGRVRLDIVDSALELAAISQDWNGAVKARLRAIDGAGQSVESSNFTITVTPVNDPPRFERPGPLAATQGVMFDQTLNVTDPDDVALVFATNATFLYLDEAMGTITFLPGNGDVGRHLFWVNVTDDEGASDRLNLTLTVANVNDPPELGLLTDIVAAERTPFTLKVNASDPDLDIGMDRLRFSCLSDLFNITPSGLISFTPQQKDVGEHPVTITVTDDYGLSDSASITFTVTEVNDPPTVERPADITVEERRPVSFRINASDPDKDDALTFFGSSPMFTISPGGWVNFTPTSKDIGTSTVRITVTDRGGLNASVEFRITVTDVNDPPRKVRIDSPTNGTVFKEGDKMALSASAVDDDGDELEFSWFADGNAIGTGKNLSAKGLRPGRHNLTVEASDGVATNSSAPVEILVIKKPQARGSVPMAGPGAVALAAFIAVLLAALRRSPGRPG